MDRKCELQTKLKDRSQESVSSAWYMNITPQKAHASSDPRMSANQRFKSNTVDMEIHCLYVIQRNQVLTLDVRFPFQVFTCGFNDYLERCLIKRNWILHHMASLAMLKDSFSSWIKIWSNHAFLTCLVTVKSVATTSTSRLCSIPANPVKLPLSIFLP